MPYPEWVEKHKKQGYDIKNIRGNYYMYERKSRWDKAKKKAVKVTGAYIGKVTPEGIIPVKPRIDITKPIFSYELGASAYLYTIAGDILEDLKKHFDKKTAESIWATSMIRLISPSPFRRIEDRYHTSWMSKILPHLNLSKNAMTALIDQIGNNRVACAAFMRDTMKPAAYTLIDGSRVTSKSEEMERALPGHSKDNKYLPQLNQIYVVSASGAGERIPVFYRNVAGNMPDVAAFALTMEDAGITGATILADNGFASADNFEIMAEPGTDLKYIVPLRRNSSEIELSQIEYEDVFTYHKRAIFAHMKECDGYRIYVFRDEKMRSKEIADFVGRKEKSNAAAEKKKTFDPDKDLSDIYKTTKDSMDQFGVIIFRTTVMDQPAQYIYETYREYYDLKRYADKLEERLEVIKVSGCSTATPLKEKLVALEKLYGQYSVHALCEALDVSRGTFYNHIFRKKDVTAHDKRREELRVQIKEIFDDSRQRFGANKVCAVLAERGIRTTYKLVAELMRDMGLYSVGTNSKREYQKGANSTKKQNLLQRQFNVTEPDRVWVSDVTCFKVKEKFYYICVIMDLFSRKIISHRVSNSNSTYLITSTFKKALEARKCPKNLIFHNDRGTQYVSNAFQKLLRMNKVVQSFSKSGSPHDNAVVEAFFASMKKEELYRTNYRSEREFIESVDTYIHFYNSERPHRTLAYKTPERFEALYGKQVCMA